MIFVINQFLIIGEMIICKVVKNDLRIYFLLLNFFQLSSLLGLRDISVGIDSSTYAKLFSWMAAGNRGYLEIGNYYLTRMAMLIKEDYQSAFIMYAVLTVGLSLYAIYYLADDPYIATLLYSGLLYYSFAFNGMRQALACSIVMVSYVYIKKQHIKPALILIAIAGCFHYSAYISYIIFPFVLNKIQIRNNRSQLIFLSVVLLFFIIMGNYGFQLMEYLKVYLPKYAMYIDRHAQGLGYQHRQSSWNIVFYLVIYLFCYYHLTRRNIHKKFDRISLTILGIGVTIYFIAMNFALVGRVALYFTIPVLWLLPNITNYLKGIREKQIYQCVLALMSVAYECALIYVEANGMVPYFFYWE